MNRTFTLGLVESDTRPFGTYKTKKVVGPETIASTISALDEEVKGS